MEALPSSVEAYLLEAGFSGTEIVILKKLLTENALTQRELASKTGKSTGVLDQATKKLMKKGIVTRETINGTPKYVMQSLDTVVQWMQNDMSAKQDMLQRRHENFESFVRSLTVTTQKRPEMEYFEGLEGMKKAYMQILEYGNDIVQYGPTLYLAEEDPLRDFRVQYFRERRGRSIFSRVVTHDTVLGRRAQSRDPFEYRRTILVDPEIYPFSFEKIISGETVACFDLEQNRACFIHFPQLALDEKIFFDRLWNKKVGQAKTNVPESEMNVPPQRPVVNVPLKTRTLSQVREFMLSRKSVTTFTSFALIAAAVTYGLYRHNVSLNTQRIQERVKSIAATGTLQFDAADLNELRTLKDIEKPQYAKVVYQLNQIRNQNEDIRYAYLMRPTDDIYIWEFIADADALQPHIEADVDNDGVITETDEKNFPGQSYDVASDYLLCQESLLQSVAFGPFTDQWGTLISGWAPIEDKTGKAVAILGIDIDATRVNDLTESTFTPIYYFLSFFFLFVLIRLAAFNRSLFQEICELCKARKIVLFFAGGFLAACLISFVSYRWDRAAGVERAREKILAIATTGAVQFSAGDLDQLHVLQDIQKPAYERVVNQLHQIREQNEKIKYAYIIRPKRGSTTFEFIADADDYERDLFEEIDFDKNGVVDSSDETPYPGLSYDVSHIETLRMEKYFSPVVTSHPYEDKWGIVFTGYAPIKNSIGNIAGILAIDVDAADAYGFHFAILIPLLIYFVILFAYILFRAPAYKGSLMHSLWLWVARKKVLYATAFILMGIYWFFFCLNFYTMNLIKDQLGQRLMAIAVTAASQIDASELENLRIARDMQSAEYQHVFRQLNEIRNKNPEIKYAYIWRSTETEGIWEFVVDADSNYYISEYYDHTGDEEMDEADENLWPGQRIDVAFSSPLIYKEGFFKPIYEMGVVDQWGTFITGSAPIFNSKGEPVAVLGLDVLVNDVEY